MRRKFEKGFTLVEIIISIAIFGIIAIVLLDMLTIGVNGISSAGIRNKGLYTAQQTIENEIRQNTKTDSANGPISVDYNLVSSFSISFNNGKTMVLEDGNILNIIYNDGKRNVALKTYLPK
jgi:prepilin-type N-terminal cleavage/methylation domain-containing protein